MILVIVGLMYGFDRLIKKMDDISKIIDEEVIMQIGDGKYIPKNAKFFRFINEKRYLGLIEKSNILISHAGIGTIITAINYKKPIIVVPRNKKYKEHVDNHQIEIARILESDIKLNVVYNIEQLEDKIQKIRKNNYKFYYISQRKNLINKIDDYLNQFS